MTFPVSSVPGWWIPNPTPMNEQGEMSSPEAPAGDWTEERLFGGRLLIRQSRTGYRYGLDTVLLAALTDCGPSERAVDLGTGCGVIPIVMIHRGRGREWLGLEVQEELVRLARSNVAANGFSAGIHIEQADFREISGLGVGGWADLVVSNPPYGRFGAGRVGPDPKRALARQEQVGTLDGLFRAAAHLLHSAGRLALIYPASRLVDLIQVGGRFGFHPGRLTFVHIRPGDPARLIHATWNRRGGSDLVVAPPFFVHTADGAISPELERLSAG